MSTTPSPSTNIPVESLGPAGIKGELHVLALMENEQRQDHDRLCDKSERSFKVAILLSKASAAVESIKGDFGPEDGGSYLLLPEEAILLRVRCAEGMFEFNKNSQGENSMVQFECTATAPSEARNKFQMVVLPFIDYLSYLANCPVVVATMRIEDLKNDRTTIEYISPYRKATVNPHISTFPIEMGPVYSMYREAKNSNSDFYKFLCYYKILEGLLGTLRANIFMRARDKGITLERTRESVPDSMHIPDRYRVHVGKPVKGFFDEVMTPQFRNAVAHFVTDDGAILNMSAPEHIDNFSEILFVCELCVRTVIQSHETLIKGLQSKDGI